MTRDIITTSGGLTLVSVDGTLTIERDGTAVCTEDDGDRFHEYVGIYFGARVELAVATGALTPTPGQERGADEPDTRPVEAGDDEDRREAAAEYEAAIAETRALEAAHPGRRLLPVDSNCTCCGRFHRFEPCEHCDDI